MNGLEVSERVSRLSMEIEALNKILMKVEGDMDYRYETKVLNRVISNMNKEKEVLQDKLRSINF